MAVPKAAVDEDDGAVLGQYEVGLAGEALVVEPVPVTSAPQFGPHNLLRGRVPGADAGHVVGALGRYFAHGLNAVQLVITNPHPKSGHRRSCHRCGLRI